MAEPSFVRPSQQMIQAWDWLMKRKEPFTSLQFSEGADLNRSTARAYLRGFCKVGILKESPQYPFNVYDLEAGWEKTVQAERIKAAYYYS